MDVKLPSSQLPARGAAETDLCSYVGWVLESFEELLLVVIETSILLHTSTLYRREEGGGVREGSEGGGVREGSEEREDRGKQEERLKGRNKVK